MRRAFVMIAAILTPIVIQAQSAQPPSPSEAADRLRSLWYRQAYLDGVTEGSRLARTFSQSPEVRAWFLINYSTAGYTDQAIDSTQALLRAFPSSPWAIAARAFALSDDFERGKEAMSIARRAYRAAPGNEHIALINAIVLQRYGRYAEAVPFVDTLMAKFGRKPELLALQGELLATRGRQPNADSTFLPRSRAAFAEAQRNDSANVNAWYRAAMSFANVRGDTMVYRLLKRAAELSPSSSAIHSRYWSALQAHAGVADSVKRAEGEADLARFFAGHETDPAFIYVAADGYGTLGQAEKRRELQERILADFPTSRQAEMLLYNRIMARDRRDLTDTAAARGEFQRQVKEFIARPYHYSNAYLGSVYLSQLSALRADSTTPAADLLASIRGTVKYNRINPHITHYELPLLLADRKLDLPLATRLANESLDRWEIQLDAATAFATPGEILDRRANVTAQKFDMLGWIAFQEGKLKDAARQLDRARELSKQNSTIYYHLGRIAEAEQKTTEAEQHYARGYQLETSGFAKRTENVTELRRLYSARHRSLDGFDAYVESLKEEDRMRRRARIAESRIAEPKPAPAFSLERLALDSSRQVERVTSTSLRGKIAVVNFWGVWCGPCVAEMPELQKFHDRFKDDTSVVFVTVDYNDDRRAVKDWMIKRKFTMPVLLDDGFVRDKAKISAYPTTWFIDRDGAIAFTHKGASEVVLEEFVWRVEMLKAGRTVP